MLERLINFEVSHKTAPLPVRERLQRDAVGKETLRSALSAVAEEFVILDTCGRFEVYALATTPGSREWSSLLADAFGLAPETLSPFIRVTRGASSARHLFRVAAGLESQLVGEPHIQGQVRRAFEAGVKSGTVGPFMSALWRAAIHNGKRVRSETDIETLTPSLARLAVDSIARSRGPLESMKVLVIGGGRMAREVLLELAHRQAGEIVVSNRDPDRAHRLAALSGASVVSFDRWPGELIDADAAIVSTAATSFLITPDSMLARRGKPLTLIDLGMPRNVNPTTRTSPGVELIDLDDLSSGNAPAGKAVRRAEHIVEAELNRFIRWVRGRGVAPIIAKLVGLHKRSRDRRRALHRPIMLLKEGVA